MEESQGLSHAKRESKYPVVFIAKCRGGSSYNELRRPLGVTRRDFFPLGESLA